MIENPYFATLEKAAFLTTIRHMWITNVGEEWFKEFAQRYSPKILELKNHSLCPYQILHFFWGLLGAKSQNIGVAAAIPPEPSLKYTI